jgi:alpha-1,3-glucan synthase
MGDLIGFEGYLNESTPFDVAEHRILWKGPRQYLDFAPSNQYNETCTFPEFWNETGYPVDAEVNKQFKGCYNGDFDQVSLLQTGKTGT